MMQSALGASSLEKNFSYLMTTLRGQVTGSPKAEREVGWAVEAFRRAGVDEVHTEKFVVPNAGSEGHTKATSGAVESENVVAEIRGREEPDKFIVLGARLGDSSDAALVIDAARVIHSFRVGAAAVHPLRAVYGRDARDAGLVGIRARPSRRTRPDERSNSVQPGELRQ